MSKLSVLFTLVLLLIALPAAAQEAGEVVLADGLNNPRLLNYAPDGTLYIAEAGTAGEEEAEGELGPVQYGYTARVLRLPTGAEAEVVADNFVSAVGFNNIIGVNGVLAEDDGWWVVLGQAPAIEGAQTTGLLRLDTAGSEVRFVDFAAVEAEFNPDNDFISSNPTDIAAGQDGVYYVLDASGNALYTMTADGEPELFHVWEDLQVPTAVDVGPEGDVYVSFLSAFPFPAGSARVERWSSDGELVQTYDGLTGATDVAVADDGTIYAVELATTFGDLGWEANTGRVVVVSDSGLAPVAEGLNYPYGVAIAPDGTLSVSVNSAFVEPGTGQIIQLDPAAAGSVPEEMAPVATEEAGA